MNKVRRNVIETNEISEMRTYNLGGYLQKVLIDGKKKTNPIVIFLHGGPGSPIPFNAGCRGMFPEITDKVTMVYWDQLGCGINNHLIDETFTINHFVDMTIELVKCIKKDFPENRVCLFAVSWGSILAAKAVLSVPELIHTTVVYGQVLKQLSFNNEVFEALENSSMPPKQKERLSAIKQRRSEHRIEDLKTISTLIRKYTEGYMCKSGGKTPLGKIIWGILSSQDYSMKDFKAIVVNGYMKNKSLLNELMTIDLSETIKNINSPYYIFQGETDIVTSISMIKSFIEDINTQNPNVFYEMVEDSGHFPSQKGMGVVIKSFDLFTK